MTIAFYGPTDTRATKVAVGSVHREGSEPEVIKRWYSEDEDIRSSPTIGRETVAFLEKHGVKSSVMTDRIIGCPHEEGIDYPDGEVCPKCPFWAGRDRWTGSIFIRGGPIKPHIEINSLDQREIPRLSKVARGGTLRFLSRRMGMGDPLSTPPKVMKQWKHHEREKTMRHLYYGREKDIDKVSRQGHNQFMRSGTTSKQHFKIVVEGMSCGSWNCGPGAWKAFVPIREIRGSEREDHVHSA